MPRTLKVIIHIVQYCLAVAKDVQGPFKKLKSVVKLLASQKPGLISDYQNQD